MTGRDQFQALAQVGELQSASIAAAMEAESQHLAGDPGADQTYEAYLGLARQWLIATLEYNTAWSEPIPVEPVVQPLVNVLLRRADFVAADGDRDRARSYQAEAQELLGLLGPIAAADVRRGQASQLADEGRFHDALISLDEAARTFLDAGDELKGAQATLDLAQVYEWLGDLDRSLAAVCAVGDRMAPYLTDGPPSEAAVLAAVTSQVAAIERGEPSRTGEDVVALLRIGYELLGHEARIRLKRAEFTAAEQLLRRILPFYRGLHVGESIEFHLAVATLRQGDLDAAAALLDRIAPAFERGLFQPRRPALRMVQADVGLEQGTPTAALARADEGLVDLAEHPNTDLSWKLHLRRGRALRAANRSDEALAAFGTAAALVDDLRKGSLGYRLDTTFLTDKLPLFAEAIDLAAQQEDGDAAARLIELVKARALSATLSIPPQARSNRTPDQVRFDAVSARLDVCEYAEYAGTATAETRAERTSLLAARRDLAERIRIADPRWRGLSAPPAFDLAATLERLADGDRAALTLHHRGGLVHAVLLHDGRTRVASTELDTRTERALADYVENLQEVEPDELLFDFSEQTGVGWDHLVPAELAEEALAASTLMVVPHRTLHLLPWGGLTAGGQRLFEHTTVGVLPNLSALAALDGGSEPPVAVALLGDPEYRGMSRLRALPQAGAELADVAALYAGALLAPPVRGPEATEAAFWALAGRSDADRAVLHLVCHASLEATEPLTSGLLLTGGKADAGEIALHRIGYPEVVLSACSTGWRPAHAEDLPLTGDDALGLVASFLEAGARFVLASVPPVLDEAAHAFALAWHRHRRAGESPLGATRASQQELARRSELPAWSWVGITGYGAR